MNNKGFISISVIYSFFLVFLMLLLFIVDGYANNRVLIKKIAAKVTEEAMNVTYCEANVHNKICELVNNYNPNSNNGNVTLTNGMIYYHGSSLAKSAADGSYRYAGANPNNYVCFGSIAASCPAANLYRIIGIVPVEVVTAETDPITTEVQMLYKLIKNNYVTTTEINTGSGTFNGTRYASFNGPSGNQPGSNPQGYYWGGSSENQSNTWTTSTMYTTGLNTNYLAGLTATWTDKIAKVMWKVGGSARSKTTGAASMDIVYTNEIVNSGIIPDDYIGSWFDSTDRVTEVYNKVGLMYVSDYGYATLSSSWSNLLSNYGTTAIAGNNWLFRGVTEWTITRNADDVNNIYAIGNGAVEYGAANKLYGIRPVFYLNKDVKLVVSGHAGTASDPYRIDMG